MRPVTPDEILRLGMGFWASKALLSAVELRVFTVLAQSPAPRPCCRWRLVGRHPKGDRPTNFPRCKPQEPKGVPAYPAALKVGIGWPRVKKKLSRINSLRKSL